MVLADGGGASIKRTGCWQGQPPGPEIWLPPNGSPEGADNSSTGWGGGPCEQKEKQKKKGGGGTAALCQT